MLTGKNVLLCVSGGIAVYKACALTSKLTQVGAIVKVVMTEGATKFVTPLTFQSLSREPVYVDTFEEQDATKITHIDVADWADVVIIAPATANIIGKIANGIADDLVSTMLLATTAPVLIAPAMNVHMYDHPAVKANLTKLRSFGYQLLEPSEGYLACGYVGKGRLMEPEDIIVYLEKFFQPKSSVLAEKKVLVTAGPTQEKLDPVRYLTNHSSGKMGYAIAEEAANRGAHVILVSGPTNIQPPANVTFNQVTSAEDMFEKVMAYYNEMDVVVKSAAVADYRPKRVSDQKIKKQPNDLAIEMERTTDILKTLGEQKKHQLLIGFAAESEQLEFYAQDKLKRKNLDMIVGNNIALAGAGFQGDTNIVTIFKKDGTSLLLPLMSKKEVASNLLNEIELLVKENEK
ncbi:bifunctional phosphopantothenoylcysteine decarboxylase/phosphopantothenate--cysteine ligase CoaBC [Anaerobacillus isosaccharinicus]|uniref:Coenzyme A biosynthesis bifunctional protein CoaBC n=1 Tax=Anaerobacillus isosaccharinicus TaxID=1532552 RepID=A0A1S2M9P6_9BACI|nr:bifunctional phosphopantothenoylcysteine decarboxylase/phosphopantothenate--cysteine ligase CoaBC [Anaerobacillus isosaccharinicus]MBA5587396.1 bifunctional phosphopantothenoylcysteine decarboxylase/phosphopantothenate--cysteine ligase CoaBC [Anaerobacillus isosaccharinicus]QOY34413.1 bifunctional phosphopantothenoylcysteine decarboxylase/phosphopantothenate--cysteine ligase CoaBC [Anaerobacillus isosaccharinicus]